MRDILYTIGMIIAVILLAVVMVIPIFEWWVSLLAGAADIAIILIYNDYRYYYNKFKGNP